MQYFPFSNNFFLYQQRNVHDFIVIIHKHNRRMRSRGDLGWSTCSAPGLSYKATKWAVLQDETKKTEVPCLSWYDTIKISPCSKAISAQQRYSYVALHCYVEVSIWMQYSITTNQPTEDWTWSTPVQFIFSSHAWYY